MAFKASTLSIFGWSLSLCHDPPICYDWSRWFIPQCGRIYWCSANVSWTKSSHFYMNPHNLWKLFPNIFRKVLHGWCIDQQKPVWFESDFIYCYTVDNRRWTFFACRISKRSSQHPVVRLDPPNIESCNMHVHVIVYFEDLMVYLMIIWCTLNACRVASW